MERSLTTSCSFSDEGTASANSGPASFWSTAITPYIIIILGIFRFRVCTNPLLKLGRRSG